LRILKNIQEDIIGML